ncbi:MAG: type 1 glutamine amidotransferase [Humidesulfovibrio sp.]|nr:type 1 glutamine amidotransferase [Humidesulfovibrio sp.]
MPTPTPLRLHGIRHESFEREAEIAVWAAARGHSLTHTDLWKGEALPNLASFDWIIVMGGPMGVYDDDKYPWLAGEKRFLRQAVDAGKLVLGVCLGAQLLSVVLGGAVTRNRHSEIGWHEVQAGPQAALSRIFCCLPNAYEAFHWHGDTFSIPEGALWTAKSEGCAHQAFEAKGGRVVGLQFHLETNAGSMAEIAEHCADEIRLDPQAQPYIQPVAAMLERPERLAALRGLLDRILDNMAALG